MRKVEPCWNCGGPVENEKCIKCGATQEKPPKLGPSPLGEKYFIRWGASYHPASVKDNEFKMPSPAKQPGRKPLKGQPPIPGL
jgi:hypothetical protein